MGLKMPLCQGLVVRQVFNGVDSLGIIMSDLRLWGLLSGNRNFLTESHQFRLHAGLQFGQDACVPGCRRYSHRIFLGVLKLFGRNF